MWHVAHTHLLATRREKDNKKNEWFEVDKKMNSSNYKLKKINYEYFKKINL